METGRPLPLGVAHRPPKPQRILACVLCQQRKVKCDRKFPCNHCVKAKVQCVPAQQMPRRRRKPTEQDLMERLRQYEVLLKKNNIAVDPVDDMEVEDATFDSATGRSSTRTDNIKDEEPATGSVKNFWDAMHSRPLNQRDGSETSDVDNNNNNATFDDLSEPAIVKIWGRVFETDHNHLFGDSKVDGPLSMLHPSHVQIFRLWQVYSDNINPLLKITHAPTLQARILDAAVDINGISRELEALMFSIYCTAIITMSEDDCRTIMGGTKAGLLSKYQDACRQALINCGFLRSRERDCLTAFFLYLISLRPDTHPHTLSPMFAIAFRIAHRMNISNEATNAKHSIFEAEMRRRLWWAMVLYDSRISEMTDYKVTQLVPTWDCKTPSNVNDFDLRPEMTARPPDLNPSTEALFAVMRGAIGNLIRYNAWHLDFVNPMLRHVAKATQHVVDPYDDNLNALEQLLETRYIAHCNPEIPLHYITMWWARNYLAKYRFFLHCSRQSSSPAEQSLSQRDAVLSYALRMLECDTALMSSPLTKGYRWLIQFHFPFPAYVRIVQDLRARPLGAQADKAWQMMNANYGVRFVDMEPSANLLFKMFATNVLQAWNARCAALFGADENGDARKMVRDIKKKLGQPSPPAVGSAPGFSRESVGLQPSEVQTLPALTQNSEIDFNPSLAELNADFFDMDWSSIDWSAVSAMGITPSLAVSLALWIIPLLFCLWSSGFVAQYRFNAAYATECIQVENEFGQARYCDICKIFQKDRMYHSDHVGKCLPLLDHFCPWWNGSVWRDNIKAYLLFVPALSVHLLFCFGVSIWVISDPRFKNDNPHIYILLVDGPFFLFALWVSFAFWVTFAFTNITQEEINQDTIWYRLPTGSIVAWIPGSGFRESPWNMGWRENVRLAMGRKRDALCFWKPSPLATADPLPTRNLAPTVALQEIRSSSSRSRRSAAQSSSTGFEAELSRWSDSVRQRRATDNT
ncbi:hypothetical protein E8E13_000709 [Curvularia kusanoi]|uniref:Zn(2)-C6 fungal-type domain-containing protein n=1 Tax=Curvularia kusanoi TaxID=90978 RepID=A0A9P4TBH8_CURKU|nr:hypothetical protein E8E13_000709 [Curvularia kusanoi]